MKRFLLTINGLFAPSREVLVASVGGFPLSLPTHVIVMCEKTRERWIAHPRELRPVVESSV